MSDLDSILKGIKKKYGNVIKKGKDILDQRKGDKVIPIGPALDANLKGGIKEGTWLMLSGAPKCGKAQPLYSKVYTPYGPVRMGDVYVGMNVCGLNGKVGTIKNIFPQGLRKIYKISFNDGTNCHCDGGHLWRVRRNKIDGFWEQKTTEELLGDVSYTDRDKWCINTSYINYESKGVPIHPYLMGVILADGYIMYNKLYLKTNKDNIINEITTLDDVKIEKVSDDTYEIKDMRYLHTLQIYNIFGRSDFHVPSLYKYNSFNTRKELIRGYLNANGYFNNVWECSSSNMMLKNDLAEVVRSLGFRATVNDNKIFMKISEVGFYKFGDFIPPKYTETKTISMIEEIGEEYCQCIEVEGTDGLYLTDNLIVTHNTTTAMQLAFNCQKEGRPVIYINAEGRLSEMNFEVQGLDPDKMIIITAEDKPLSAEEFLGITLELISSKENEGALCIIDSISSLIPAKDLDEDITGLARPGLPKILSNFVKKAGQIVPNNKITMVMITHLIANTSGYGPTKMADSGIKIQYQADTRMEVKAVTPWVQDDVQVGQSVKWKIYYSSKGATGIECDSFIRYGYGIDDIQESLLLGEELAFIAKSGAWYSCPFLIEHERFKLLFPEADEKFGKFQGIDKLYNFLKDNPAVLDILKAKIKEALA